MVHRHSMSQCYSRTKHMEHGGSTEHTPYQILLKLEYFKTYITVVMQDMFSTEIQIAYKNNIHLIY